MLRLNEHTPSRQPKVRFLLVSTPFVWPVANFVRLQVTGAVVDARARSMQGYANDPLVPDRSAPRGVRESGGALAAGGTAIGEDEEDPLLLL